MKVYSQLYAVINLATKNPYSIHRQSDILRPRREFSKLNTDGLKVEIRFRNMNIGSLAMKRSRGVGNNICVIIICFMSDFSCVINDPP